MINVQEQVKKALCYQKLFLPFTVWINCSNDLKKFANSQPSTSNFKSFSHSRSEQFGQQNTISATSAQIFRFLWFMPSLGVRSPWFKAINTTLTVGKSSWKSSQVFNVMQSWKKNSMKFQIRYSINLHFISEITYILVIQQHTNGVIFFWRSTPYFYLAMFSWNRITPAQIFF